MRRAPYLLDDPRMVETANVRAAASPRTLTRKPLFTLLLPYLLVAPTLILVFAFTLYPAVQTVNASLYRPPRNVQAPAEFVGLQNYLDLFNPAHFIGSRFTLVFGNTLFFAVVTVALCVPLALLFALLLNRRIRFIGLYRFGLFYPALLPMIGAASIWAFLFADTIGLASVIARKLGVAAPNWLGNPDTVLLSVTLVNIWKQAGFYMIFYLAGLQNIPTDIYEAADLEGASRWQQLRFLTIPLLRRTTLFVLVVAFTFAFQTVEHLQALGMGGPGDRSNLLLYLIFQSIPERRNWGYVNAMTVLLVLVLLVFTITNLFAFERGGREDA
jgi:sn-glycerol 3-phosphate transport system permease protein